MEPSLSVGRRVHDDGGLLHPDALGHEPAAHGREPDDPRRRDSQLRRLGLRTGCSGRRPARPPARRRCSRRATCCATPPSTAPRRLRLDSKTGSLTPGKEADIIILDATALNVAPLNHVPGAVVSLMDRTNVETVIVAGKVRKWKGKLLDVDLTEAAPAARGLARLHLHRGGRPAEPVPVERSRRRTPQRRRRHSLHVDDGSHRRRDRDRPAGKVRKWKGKLLDVDLRKLRRDLENSRDVIFDAAKSPPNLRGPVRPELKRTM